MSIFPIYYGLVYKEQIHNILTNKGLTPEEADLFLKYASKGKELLLEDKFTGSYKQWDILIKASKTAVSLSHAVSNFEELNESIKKEKK